MNKKSDNKVFWDRFSKIYDLIIKKDHLMYDHMISLITQNLSRNMNVLELATGTGILAVELAQWVNSYEATDFSNEMIEISKNKAKISNLQFSVQDACNLLYEEKKFDAVIISNALHIMPNPQKALDNIKKVLKNDGILIAPTFVHSQKMSSLIKSKIMGIVGFRAYHKWTYEGYINFLEIQGWKIIKQQCLKGSFPLAYIVCEKENEICL